MSQSNDPLLTDADALQAALDKCASEPVHIPGLVQPLGGLLALERAALTVGYASENLDRVLGDGFAPAAVLGQGAAQVLPEDLLAAVQAAEARGALALRRKNLGSFAIGAQQVEVAAYASGDFLVLELEPAPNTQDAQPEATLSDALLDLDSVCDMAEDEDSMWVRLVDLLQELSGYDRVLAYRFDAEFNGAVIAECCAPDMEALLGLRFPHWDIPAQARKIMETVPLRFIADVDADPAPILAASAALPRLDMTQGHLRGVSPVHLQYLRNLGSRATLTLSVLQEGRLWGMVSFHHRSPRAPSAALRALLIQMAPLITARLGLLARSDALRVAARVEDLCEITNSELAVPGPAEAAFARLAPQILEHLEADGLVLRAGEETFSFGQVPSSRAIGMLVVTAMTQEAGTLVTEELSGAVPGLPQGEDDPAGAVVVAQARDKAFAVFRRPISQKIAWAGAPQKTLDQDEDGPRLSPRGSFTTYLEEVDGQSQAWSDLDLQFARSLARSCLSAFEFRAAAVAFGEQQFLMMNELNHRVKNLLSLMGRLARGGRRDNKTIDSYAASQEARIATLARAYDAYGQGLGDTERWVPLGDVLAAEFRAGEAVSLPNGRVELRSNSVPLLAMVLHELAANARNHGALSQGGEVMVGLVERDGLWRLIWQEHGGPAVPATPEPGFGLTLIREAIPFELGGKAEVTFARDGLRAVLEIPSEALRPMVDTVGASTPATPAKPVPEVPAQVPELLRQGQAKCLLLEDNFVISMTLSASLRDIGCQSVAAHSNVGDALNYLQDHTPDFACLDINLGARQGSSVPVADQLMALGVPFVFVTGYGELNQLPPRLSDRPVLGKPFTEAELQAAISGLLNTAH